MAESDLELSDAAARGDAAGAVERLFERYARRLSLVAERNLSGRLAGRVDGEDIVQSVFRTFFRRAAAGDFRIDSTAEIWRLLTRITIMKARAVGRFHTAAMRDARRDATAGSSESPADWLETALAREPGPDEAASLVDQIEVLLRGLPPMYCHILELRLQGVQVSEVADKLGVSRQTVYRALRLLGARLRHASPTPNADSPAKIV